MESNLNSDFSDGEVNCAGFKTYRSDRNAKTSKKASGGGVLIFVNDKIQSQCISLAEERVEQLFILCQFNRTKFLVGGVYIPPQSSRESYTWHCASAENLCQQYPDLNMYLFGDYNLPNAVWSNDEFGTMVQCPSGDPALEVARSFGYLKFFQHNNIPNNRGVFLDLAFSNDRDLVVTKAGDLILDLSLHHTSYECSIVSPETLSNNLVYNEFYYDFRNGNYRELNNYIASIDWVTCLGGSNNINEATNFFYELLSIGIAYFVPLKKYRTSSFPKWFSSELRKLTLEKKQAHSLYVKVRSNCNYTRFSQLRSECKKLSDICFTNYITSLDMRLREDPRSFWKYINDKRSSHSLPSALYYGVRSASNGHDIANLFKDFFQTVYTVNSNSSHCLPNIIDTNSSTNITSSVILKIDIFNEISGLPNKLTSGPDGIPNFLLKQCVCTIVPPLHILFNKSLESSTFPDPWKESNIVPLFKSGKKDLIENYRSICIQSAIPKLLDCLIGKQLSWQCKGLLSQEQHGFSQNRSTVTNLVTYQSDILHNMEERKQTDSIYTDFSKAFDRVDHHILLQKLQQFGFNLNFILWFESSLTGRVQRVKIGCYYSDLINVSSGVPQGGHCSPLLFNIFVNDLVDCFINSNCLQFADDLKFWRTVESFSDRELLQEDLNRLSKWCEDNKLYLNVKKCCFISFFRKPVKIETSYSLNGQYLEYVSSIKDLGVVFDEKLTFAEHINSTSIKGSKMLGFIIRNCRYFSVESTRLVYCSLVRSILEYGSIVWSPFYQVHSDSLERVQHKFLRVCAFRDHHRIADHDYGDIERQLSLPSLCKRRNMFGSIFLFKIIRGLTDCPVLLKQVGLSVPYYQGLRGKASFVVPFHRTLYGVNSPLHRYMSLLNSVDLDVFNTSLGKFKRSFLLCL